MINTTKTVSVKFLQLKKKSSWQNLIFKKPPKFKQLYLILKNLPLADFFTCGQLRHKHIVHYLRQFKEYFLVALLDFLKKKT